MLVDDVLIGAERAIQMAHQLELLLPSMPQPPQKNKIYEQLKRPARSVEDGVAITMNDPGLGKGLADTGKRGKVEALRTDAAKIFVDGVLEGETAALIEPYDSHAGGHGHLHLDDTNSSHWWLRCW